MSLLQIAEPSQSSKPHQHKYALGIDLGTTRSLVAVVRSGKAKVLEADKMHGENPADTLLPSVVYYGCSSVHEEGVIECQNYQPLVGQSALDKLGEDPSNTIASAKRFMGRSLDDIKFSHPYQLTTNTSGEKISEKTAETKNEKADVMPSFVTDHGCKSPVEVSAEVLSVLAERAKKALPEDSIYGAVITVPAYFDEAQREATRMAAKVAGIHVLRLLNEPTAAAVAYGLDNNAHGSSQETQPKHYLIYDLGGGTFDVSILKLTDGVFEVLATGGNSALGGDDIDRLFANWLIKQVGKDPKTIDNISKTKLAHLARGYKQQLSDDDEVAIQIDIDGAELTTTVGNSDLQKIIEPVSKRTIRVCEQVLRDANLDKSQLDEVVLVGGSTRMPIIQSVVESFFERLPLCSIDPDKVVALGASQTANQLINPNQDEQLLLLDVTPLSLGLETMGGLVEIIIPRNTPIPIKKRQVFTTYKDAQNGMVIHVLQGERDTVENNRSLGRFTLSDIPPMKAGLARIEVTFSINADGQLTVTAEETSTGVQSQIDIVPSFGLSDEQQEQLLTAGYSHAQEDKESRTLRETKMEAEREILALQSALTEFSTLLTDAEKIQLTRAMQAVSESIAQSDDESDSYSNNLAEIIETQSQLKPISDKFASLIMNQSIQSTMSGTNTSDWQ